MEKISFKLSILDSNYQELTSKEFTYAINPVITMPEKEEQTNIASENLSTSSTSNSSTNSSAINTERTGISQEFKTAMDTYESCMNEYVDFMKKYKANPTDQTLISQYSTMLQKYSEQVSAFNAWNSEDMTTEEAAYYVDVQARVSKKLLEVAT